jgi:hypothetical protein
MEPKMHTYRRGIRLNSPTTQSYKTRLLRRSVQSQAVSGLPTQPIPVAFRRKSPFPLVWVRVIDNESCV